MAEIYDIDFIRAVFDYEFKDEDIFLTSFYEQIANPDNIERYGKKIYDLINDQNKEQYKGRGIVARIGESEIVNISSSYISPFDYNVRIDCSDKDRDYIVDKVNVITRKINGNKYEFLLKDDGEIIVFEPSKLTLKDNMLVRILISEIESFNFYTMTLNKEYKVYIRDSNDFIRYSSVKKTAVDTYVINAINDDIENDEYEFFKSSISISSISKEEPYINVGKDRITINISGKASLVSGEVLLGNDLTSLKINDIEVEPIDMPSSSKSKSGGEYYIYSSLPKPKDDKVSQALGVEYSFVVSENNTMIYALYRYAKSGAFGGSLSNINQVFTIIETSIRFGFHYTFTIKGKLDEVGVTKTNGDILMMNVRFDIGDY